VAQASGVPTGGLIERGSNANGEYSRFADGTMICRIDGVQFAFNTADALLYTWTYPSTFAAGESGSGPIIMSALPNAGANYVNTVATAIGVTRISNSTASVGLNLTRSAGGASFVSGSLVNNVKLIAVGRWF